MFALITSSLRQLLYQNKNKVAIGIVSLGGGFLCYAAGATTAAVMLAGLLGGTVSYHIASISEAKKRVKEVKKNSQLESKIQGMQHELEHYKALSQERLHNLRMEHLRVTAELEKVRVELAARRDQPSLIRSHPITYPTLSSPVVALPGSYSQILAQLPPAPIQGALASSHHSYRPNIGAATQPTSQPSVLSSSAGPALSLVPGEPPRHFAPSAHQFTTRPPHLLPSQQRPHVPAPSVPYTPSAPATIFRVPLHHGLRFEADEIGRWRQLPDVASKQTRINEGVGGDAEIVRPIPVMPQQPPVSDRPPARRSLRLQNKRKNS